MTKNEFQSMSISDKLADLNYTRYQEFEEEHNKKNSRPAMYAFAGDVYTGLDAYTIPTEKLDRLQDSLRILSGLYGVLKPLDLMQPYRLEMGTSVGIERRIIYMKFGNKSDRTPERGNGRRRAFYKPGQQRIF